MAEDIDSIKKHVKDYQSYDFLDFGCSQGSSLRYGVKALKGTKGIGFDIDPKKVEEANKILEDKEKYLGDHKVICQNVLDINYTEDTIHQFRFTTCIHFLEHLPGIREAKRAIFSAIKLSSKFVYIIEPNFDNDVELFKQGFKTHYSDWTSHTNHLTSNVIFNILFDFYMVGYIEDFMIFYHTPIKNSNDPAIHPLNSPKNEQVYDKNKHPPKEENIEFTNIYKDIGVIITIKGYQKIDNIYEMIKGDKLKIYDSRDGIFDERPEIHKDNKNITDNNHKKDENDSNNGVLTKVSNFLNKEI